MSGGFPMRSIYLDYNRYYHPRFKLKGQTHKWIAVSS